MAFLVVGLNHKTSPLELREAVSFTTSQREDFLKELKTVYPLGEFVILSTCNRVEIYAADRQEIPDAREIIFLLASYHHVSPEKIYPFTYSYTAKEAITHLFEVACGLDSLVIGETQIFGQLKRSYQKSLERGYSGKVLNIVFQRAFIIGKRVRIQTGISEGNVSVSSIASQLAEKVLQGLLNKKALLVGAGKVGVSTLRSLREKGTNTILVSSRSFEKAKILAGEFGGLAVRFDKVEDFMIDTDVLISATSAPHYIFHPDMLMPIMRKRSHRPLLLIDLAVPRDIDPLIGRLSGVHLYNIDSLEEQARQNKEKRKREIFHCKEIISAEVNFFIQRYRLGQEKEELVCAYPLLTKEFSI